MLQSDHYSGTGKAHLWSHNIYRALVANYNLYLCLHSKSWHVLSPEYNCSITNAEWKREFFSVWNGANALAKPSSHSSPLHYIALTKEREKERRNRVQPEKPKRSHFYCEVVKLWSYCHFCPFLFQFDCIFFHAFVFTYSPIDWQFISLVMSFILYLVCPFALELDDKITQNNDDDRTRASCSFACFFSIRLLSCGWLGFVCVCE